VCGLLDYAAQLPVSRWLAPHFSVGVVTFFFGYKSVFKVEVGTKPKTVFGSGALINYPFLFFLKKITLTS
jgi:hypothetical protein